MLHRCLLILVCLLLLAPLPVQAQEGGTPQPTPIEADAWPVQYLYLRTGPNMAYPVITTLRPGATLVLDGRNADSTWIMVHTADDVPLYGWVDATYLGVAQHVSLQTLPIRSEAYSELVVGDSTPTPEPDPLPAAPIPAPREVDLAQVSAIQLTAYPVVPTDLGRARSIFAAGGKNAHVVTKVGDCASGHPDFLTAFTRPGYNLGDYGYLQTTIDYFGESLGYESQAAHSGFNSSVILDSMWADPAVCLAGETPLACEFRLHRPAVAVIMFGTTDLQALSPEQFNGNLRAIVDYSIRAGVVPVLSTFPRHLAYPDESILYNQIVVQIALDYNVPLINLWLALEDLPNYGMADDGNHLAEPAWGGPGVMVPQNLVTGLPMRNLVTLQMLEVLRSGVLS